MPKNNKGGKGYKKGKHTTSMSSGEFPALEEGQQYGRLKKMLGNNNALVLCNDGIERLCHMRHALKYNKIWLATGDIVVISARDFEVRDGSKSTELERGDIIAKCDRCFYSQLEATQKFNKKLTEEQITSGEDATKGEYEFVNTDEKDVDIDDL